MALLSSVIGRGTFASRPAAGTAGRLYYATDYGILYRDNGSSWDALLDINSLTEDTSPSSANDFVVTYDASAGFLKKVKLSNLGTGGSGGFTQGCKVKPNANISISSGTTLQAVTGFNTEVYDTDTMHDNVTNNGRITFTTAGKYVVSVSVAWESNSSGQRQLALRRNGSFFLAADIKAANAADVTYHTLTTQGDFSATDYVEVMVWQNSGASRNILASDELTSFAAWRIG